MSAPLVVVWSTNTSRKTRLYQSAVNVRKSWRVSAPLVPANVAVCPSVKRLSPVPTVVFSATAVCVNVSFVLSSLRNKRSLRLWRANVKCSLSPSNPPRLLKRNPLRLPPNPPANQLPRNPLKKPPANPRSKLI